tara:strand:- start:33490 stop:33717 length:228 start_codon:yes stop_codon:yes gene_type:complete
MIDETTTTTTATQRLAMCQELRSVTCQCGRPKQQRHTFCVDCFRQIGRDIAQPLWRRFGNGYEEAHQAAMRILRP